MKNNIKAARESQGLTQQECAELFNVKLRAWQTYEQGVSEPKFEVLCKIADKFGVTADYLLGRPDAKPPEEPLDEFARKEHLKSLEKVFMKKYLALTEEQRDKVLDFLRGVVAEETAAQASKLKMSVCTKPPGARTRTTHRTLQNTQRANWKSWTAIPIPILTYNKNHLIWYNSH